MTVPTNVIWKIEPHTQAKHFLLKQYLSAWMPIVSSYFNELLFIDGFSGPGIYEGGEPGSPIVALSVAEEHGGIPKEAIIRFRFIEERIDRAEELCRQVELHNRSRTFDTQVVVGEFSDKILGLMDEFSPSNQHKSIPKLVMIDPFGFSGIPFAKVYQILQQQHSEVFITFMADAINRFLQHPDDSIRAHIDEAFGQKGVAQIILESGFRGRVNLIQETYKQRLCTAAKYVRAFSMHDRADRLLYFLFFATNNSLGFSKMKEAMWKLDPSGQFRFSDRTNPEQCVLFAPGVMTEVYLSQDLKQSFHGKTVLSDKVLKFTSEETAFTETHCRKALKIMEEKREIVVSTIKNDGTKRRANSFPRGITIEFKS
ncbi:MAG: three-Cys-motif partner protein TcmP [Methanothrix sp.]|nr:three-Cys-motif partner protein TcmP [Methanothrix sp.]